MGVVHGTAHRCLGLEVFQIGIAVTIELGVSALPRPAPVGSAQRMAAAMRAAGSEGNFAVEATVETRWWAFTGVKPFTSVSNDVLVDVAAFVVVGLSFPASGGEETLLALTAAAHAWRVMRVVNAPQVAPNFAAAAWDTGLVNALVLRILG